MRLIDADELTEMVWRERLDTRERIADLIARQPTIKGAVKHGYWSECYTDSYHYSGICSVCGGGAIRKVKGKPLKYCPNCGARMDLKDCDTK